MADPTDAGHTACDQRIIDDGERIAQLEADVTRLRVALTEAVESVEHWGGYAPEWAREKWDLTGDLADLRAALAEGEPHG